MMHLNVKLKSSSYPIAITNSFDALEQYIDKNPHKCIILTDDNLEKLYLQDLCLSCEKIFNKILFFVVKSGEKSKSLETAKEIYLFLMKNSVCRQDVLISLGGGVIGDLGGFVAATYLRGISFIQVPTSLLAQVDSSIGGKTAVNLNKIKNMVGVFYQPRAVYVNYTVLKTLPVKELKNGLIEVLVHAIIKDEKLFFFIEENLEEILRLNPYLLESLIYYNCKIKSRIVQNDENDLGERATLNLGHTLGHAIESFYDYKYSHGECVAIGIIGACYISEKLNFITSETTNRIKSLLLRMHALHSIQYCDKEKIIDNLMHDKKVIDGKVFFILPIRIGAAIKYKIEDIKYIREALDLLIATEC